MATHLGAQVSRVLNVVGYCLAVMGVVQVCIPLFYLICSQVSLLLVPEGERMYLTMDVRWSRFLESLFSPVLAWQGAFFAVVSNILLARGIGADRRRAVLTLSLVLVLAEFVFVSVAYKLVILPHLFTIAFSPVVSLIALACHSLSVGRSDSNAYAVESQDQPKTL